MSKLKVLVNGKGQLGWELARTAPEGVDVHVHDRDELDITDAQRVMAFVEELRPQVIINAAAYTNVDRAETDKDVAWAVNCTGVENLALAARQHGCYLLHISTDFVFDGKSSVPYQPDDATAPLGVYGASKLAGERALEKVLDNDWAILRTAWVYSSFGANFVKTILRLVQEKPQLTIIADQIGSPTWANSLALSCWQAVHEKLQGIHHCTNDGVASWYDFAVAIQELALEKGLIEKAIPILPIPTEAYPTPAERPRYSVMSKASLNDALPLAPKLHWRSALSAMLDEPFS